ncbi:hypothetical protein ALC62_09590, partial [Cyphomyrmex costatus]
ERAAVFKGADPRRPKAAETQRSCWTVNLPPAHEIIFPSKSKVLNERGHRQHHALVLTKRVHVIVTVVRDSTCVVPLLLNRNDFRMFRKRRIDIWTDRPSDTSDRAPTSILSFESS